MVETGTISHLAAWAPRMAPMSLPLDRRLQTAAVVIWLSTIFITPLFSLAILRWVRGPLLYAFLAYTAYVLLFQKHQHDGSLRIEWIRKSMLWRYYAAYFPVSLKATEPILPDKSYIFAVHPHGIIGVSAFANLATDATGFSTLFPGVKLFMCTLALNFRIPFLSTILGMHGICDASRRTCDTLLAKGNGVSIGLVIGGAREALDSRPGTCDLTLGSRKGFIKLALQHGADIVPVFCFGETDIYDQVPNPRGSTLRRIQDKLLKVLGFSMPLVKGRGVFNYDFGLLPQRRELITVVGRPMHVDKVPYAQITDAIIDRVHKEYIETVVALYEANKSVHSSHINTILRVIQ